MSCAYRGEWSGTWFRMPLTVLLCCVYFGCISCQQLDVSEVSTTRSAGGALYETTAWTPLFKLCVGGGSHKVKVQYFFPAASTERLNHPYNLTEARAPWVLLYPESSWADPYFYVVSLAYTAFFESITAPCPRLIQFFCRAIVMLAYIRLTLNSRKARRRAGTVSFPKCKRATGFRTFSWVACRWFLSLMNSPLKPEPTPPYTLRCVIATQWQYLCP